MKIYLYILYHLYFTILALINMILLKFPEYRLNLTFLEDFADKRFDNPQLYMLKDRYLMHLSNCTHVAYLLYLHPLILRIGANSKSRISQNSEKWTQVFLAGNHRFNQYLEIFVKVRFCRELTDSQLRDAKHFNISEYSISLKIPIIGHLRLLLQ